MKFTTSDGLQLVYEDEGKGIPLLCLPAIISGPRDFDDLATVVSNVRMIRLCYRGRGGSDYDTNIDNYNAETGVRDALELLEHLGIDKAVFVGTSWGGAISLLTGIASPQKVAGIILNDFGPKIELIGYSQLKAMLSIPKNVKNYMEVATHIFEILHKKHPKITLAECEVFALRWITFGPEGVIKDYDSKLYTSILLGPVLEDSSISLWSGFDALKATPLALIRGANSDLLSKETVKEMRNRHPGMIYANVPGRGHVPYLDEPLAVEAINMLLDKVRHEYD